MKTGILYSLLCVLTVCAATNVFGANLRCYEFEPATQNWSVRNGSGTVVLALELVCSDEADNYLNITETAYGSDLVRTWIGLLVAAKAMGEKVYIRYEVGTKIIYGFDMNNFWTVFSDCTPCSFK